MLLTSYHETSFEHVLRGRAVERIVKALAAYPESVGIACTGLSGILVAVPVADKTQRPFAIVRKANEESHASYDVEGYKMVQYVIVDDFISTGETVHRIIKKMEERTPESWCCGILLYDRKGSSLDCIEHKGKQIPVIGCLA